MDPSPLDDFRPDVDGLTTALQALIDHRRRPGEPHPAPSFPDPRQRFPESWPAVGIGGVDALQALTGIALEHAARLDHPGFLAHMDPPTPWFTWAATQWSAAMNQNLLHPDVAPQMRDLETVIIDWLAPSFGMDGGHLVPGSTVSTLTALWAARELRSVTEVVSSTSAHLSVAKAAHILGLPHRAVEVGPDQAIDPSRLGDLTDAALVLTAGTAGAGAVDDLSLTIAGHEPQRDRAAWVHVDAAWAGPLRFSHHHRRVLDGLEFADSVGFSAHKWLHQPKDSAVILFADTAVAHRALSFGGTYLSAPDIGVLGSSGARVLPLAVTLLAWGRSGLAEVIDAGMARIDELRDLVITADDAEVHPSHRSGQPGTGVLLWRPRDGDVRELQAQLTGAWVSLAEIDDVAWFRSVGANPVADPVLVLDRVRHAVDNTRSLP